MSLKWFDLAISSLSEKVQLELRGLAARFGTCTREHDRVHAHGHVRGQQRDEGVRVLTLSSGAWHWGVQGILRERGRVSDQAAVLGLEAHELPETLPEARGEQVVDDGVDGWAEVEEDARHDVDVLVNVVHQVGPLADGTPQEPLGVEGSPADSEHGHDDGWRVKVREWVYWSLMQLKHVSLLLF